MPAVASPTRRRKTSRVVPSPTAHTPRWLMLAGVTVALAILVLFGLFDVAGSDLYMHLFLGRYIWQHGDVPRVDVFSYVNAGGEFIAHSWGAELIFYGLEQTAGTLGFALLRLMLVSVALWCALQTARLLGASWPAILLVTPAVLGIVWGRAEVRPQLFSTAFLAIQLWILISVHMGARSPRWLWILPPLFGLWINLHPGWPQGLAILVGIIGIVTAMHARQRWLGMGDTSKILVHTLSLVLVACLLVLPLNPYGLRLSYFPLEMQAAWIREGFEWQAPWFNPNWRMVGGGAYVGGIEWLFWAYMILLVGVVLASLWRWRTVDLVPLGLMSFWVAMALWHQRASTDAVLLTSPLLAAGLGSAWWHHRQWPVWVGIGGCGLLIGVAVSVMSWPMSKGWQWNSVEPHCAASTIARLGLSGHMLSANGRGGIDYWLLYKFWPQVKVYLTWEYVMGQTGFTALRVAEEEGGLAGLQGFLDRHHVNTLIAHTIFEEYIVKLEAYGWAMVHLDNRFFILVRQRSSTADLIAREGYRHIRTLEGALQTVTEANAGEVLNEAERALRHCPGEGATFAWSYKTRALRLLGRHQEADAAARQIPEELIIPL